MKETKLAQIVEDFNGICCVKECNSKIFAVGLCNAHWTRNRRYGSPILIQRPGQYALRLTAIKAFNLQIRKSDNGCWIWMGRKDWRGYGRFKRTLHDIVHIKAHRWSWAYHNDKPIPPGMGIMHSCDMPACVNPDHLMPGTQAENIADMYRKGRGKILRGIEQGRAKITEADVIAIRASNLSQMEIAAQYGIAQVQVSRIIRRESWKHIA